MSSTGLLNGGGQRHGDYSVALKEFVSDGSHRYRHARSVAFRASLRDSSQLYGATRLHSSGRSVAAISFICWSVPLRGSLSDGSHLHGDALWRSSGSLSGRSQHGEDAR